jgi:endo-1,4-beta-xylanase
VYGHVLLWHQQQNTVYLNAAAGGSYVGPNIANNPGFETWTTATSAPDTWTYANGSTYFSQTTAAANVHSGSYALAVGGYGANGGSGWRVQLKTTIPTIVGHKYTISFWAKGSTIGLTGGPGNPNIGGCYWQGEWDASGSVKYTGDQQITSTAWTKYDMKFDGSTVTPAAATTSTAIQFDMGTIAIGETVWLDDVVINDYTQDSIDAAANASNKILVAARLDSVMQLWIQGNAVAPGIVTHYKGKIPAWDVANEVMTDAGVIRDNKNTSAGNGIYVWTDILGKTGIVNAFKYAHAADPAAKLFINDYNLEASKAKTDSMVALVNYLKSKGAQVDGIGTQMHCSLSSSYAGIDYMFQQLAATGLLVKITELDVTMSASALDHTVGDPITLGYQANMYKYIISSYMKNVPAAQRYGITVWGVDDPDSWRASQLPLLWDKNFAKKPAYSGFLQGLKQQ